MPGRLLEVEFDRLSGCIFLSWPCKRVQWTVWGVPWWFEAWLGNQSTWSISQVLYWLFLLQTECMGQSKTLVALVSTWGNYIVSSDYKTKNLY